MKNRRADFLVRLFWHAAAPGDPSAAPMTADAGTHAHVARGGEARNTGKRQQTSTHATNTHSNSHSPTPPTRLLATRPAATGKPSPGTHAGDAAAYLRSVGLSQAHLAAVEAKHPDTLKAGVDTVLRPKVGLLQSKAGLTGEALGAVLAAQPKLLATSLDRHLAPTVDFFRAGLGLRASSLARIAAARPVILTYDVDAMKTKAAFFEGLGIDAAGLRRMLTRSPDLLSIGVGNDLKPTVDYLKSVGITGTDLADLLVAHPTIFHCPLSVARENVATLKAAGVSDAGVRTLLLGAPVLFRRSLASASMRAKLKFWEAIGKKVADLPAAPRFLARSLPNTSGPRIEFAAKLASGAIPGDVSHLLDGPDDAFAAERLGAPGAAAEFLAFRKAWPAVNAAKYGFKP